MDIAQHLSWEIVAMNELDPSQEQRTAVEVAYGVALQLGDQPELFSAFMSSIIGQVTDPETKRLLRLYTARGLRK
jgi:hypothetical protein